MCSLTRVCPPLEHRSRRGHHQTGETGGARWEGLSRGLDWPGICEEGQARRRSRKRWEQALRGQKPWSRSQAEQSSTGVRPLGTFLHSRPDRAQHPAPSWGCCSHTRHTHTHHQPNSQTRTKPAPKSRRPGAGLHASFAEVGAGARVGWTHPPTSQLCLLRGPRSDHSWVAPGPPVHTSLSV